MNRQPQHQQLNNANLYCNMIRYCAHVNGANHTNQQVSSASSSNNNGNFQQQQPQASNSLNVIDDCDQLASYHHHHHHHHHHHRDDGKRIYANYTQQQQQIDENPPQTTSHYYQEDSGVIYQAYEPNEIDYTQQQTSTLQSAFPISQTTAGVYNQYVGSACDLVPQVADYNNYGPAAANSNGDSGMLTAIANNDFGQQQANSFQQEDYNHEQTYYNQTADTTRAGATTTANLQQMPEVIQSYEPQVYSVPQLNHLDCERDEVTLQVQVSAPAPSTLQRDIRIVGATPMTTNGSTVPNSQGKLIHTITTRALPAYNQQQQQQQQQQPLQSIPRPRQPQQQQQNDYIAMRSNGNVPQDWLDTICRHMIEHMNHFGICVIDNFLGSAKGDLILNEVLQLFSSRSYMKGRLVNNKLNAKNQRSDGNGAIRSDRVIWVDDCEIGCDEINNLIQTLCSVITNSSRLSLYSNNALDNIVINKRTKAHVTCYPGNGTYYIKHVDNPNNDGRVITAIYYMNKNWNTKRDGGLLRMFPVGMDEVANIEPFFDRVLFFWSDRRNPHEVLPAYTDRYAITVWFISENRNQT